MFIYYKNGKVIKTSEVRDYYSVCDFVIIKDETIISNLKSKKYLVNENAVLSDKTDKIMAVYGTVSQLSDSDFNSNAASYGVDALTINNLLADEVENLKAISKEYLIKKIPLC